MPCDYSKYPPNWKKEIVPRILKRADNKCEVCGLKNRQHVYSISLYLRSKENGRYGFKSVWVRDIQDAIKIEPLGTMKVVRIILTIAHLDHDETNHNVTDDRLKAMCQKCHLAYDTEEKYNRIIQKSRS